MRHLWSLLAGVVTAPLAWVLIAAGQSGSDRTISSWVKTDSYSWANLIGPAVYLAVAGLLLGLIGTLRFSPAGPMAAGLLLVIPYAGLFASPFAVRDAIPADWNLFNENLPLHVPLDNGTLLLIGALLLMATLSLQRWRRWPAQDAATATPVTSSGSDDERALTDWPPAEPESETPAPTLGYPKSDFEPAASTVPLPRREPGSPWSGAPRSMAGRGQTTD